MRALSSVAKVLRPDGPWGEPSGRAPACQRQPPGRPALNHDFRPAGEEYRLRMFFRPLTDFILIFWLSTPIPDSRRRADRVSPQARRSSAPAKSAAGCKADHQLCRSRRGLPGRSAPRLPKTLRTAALRQVLSNRRLLFDIPGERQCRLPFGAVRRSKRESRRPDFADLRPCPTGSLTRRYGNTSSPLPLAGEGQG